VQKGFEEEGIAGGGGRGGKDGVIGTETEYPDWKWNKFWSMHVPWEDRRLFVVPPEIYLYKKDEYDLELKRVQDKSLSAIFCFYEYDAQTHDYFFTHSVISRLAKEFPHVALYQIIIDHRYVEDLNNVMKEYNINCTPTFRFFQNGKKVHDVAGGSTVLLEKTLEKIYGGEEKSRTQGFDTQVKKDKNGEEVYSVFEVEAAAGDKSDTSYELKYYSKCPCDLCHGMRRLRQWLSQQSETQIAKDEK
ncbi:hypothetical protein DVH24_002670, partial [Malus domestica]